MSSKYKFLTTHLEKAIRELLLTVEHNPCGKGDRRVPLETKLLLWDTEVQRKAQAVREALED